MKPIVQAERYTLSKLVVRSLKQYMIQNKLTPGDKLPAERELARTMNVSRTVLREALRSLESAGILVIRHGEGAFLSANSLSPLLEQLAFTAGLSAKAGGQLRQIRCLLETSAVEEAFRLGLPLPFDQLEHWRAAAAQDKPEQREAAIEADIQLHLTVVRTLGNDSLSSLAELFIRQSAMADADASADSAERAAEEHGRYIAALRAGDATEAVRILRKHVYKDKLDGSDPA